MTLHKDPVLVFDSSFVWLMWMKAFFMVGVYKLPNSSDVERILFKNGRSLIIDFINSIMFVQVLKIHITSDNFQRKYTPIKVHCIPIICFMLSRYVHYLTFLWGSSKVSPLYTWAFFLFKYNVIKIFYIVYNRSRNFVHYIDTIECSKL